MADIIGGYAFPSQTLKGNKGPRVIRISDISEKGFVNSRLVRYNGPTISDNYQVRENDILMAMTGGTMGKSLFVTYLPEEMLLNQRVAIIRNQWITSEYINLVLKAPHVMAIVNDRKNSTNDNISMVDIYNFLVPLPCVSQQKKIVEQYYVLLPEIERYNEAQDRLDTLNKSIHERLRKSILQEAIQGKLVEQDQTEEPVSVLLERIRVEKNRLIKEDKLKKKDVVDSVIFKGEDNKYYEKVDGKILDISEEISFEIPNSWQWVRLGTLFSHNTGKALNRADTDGIKKKYLTTSNVYWNRFEFKEVREMYFTDLELEKCTVHKGDLLVCEGGDIGRSAIWQYDEEICIQNHIHRLRAYYPVNTEFYYLVFYHYKNIGNIGGKGIGIQGLSSGALHRLIVPLPPIEEQNRITQKYNDLIASTMRK